MKFYSRIIFYPGISTLYGPYPLHPIHSILVYTLSYNRCPLLLAVYCKNRKYFQKGNIDGNNTIASITASNWTMAIWKCIDQNRMVGVPLSEQNFTDPFEFFAFQWRSIHVFTCTSHWRQQINFLSLFNKNFAPVAKTVGQKKYTRKKQMRMHI